MEQTLSRVIERGMFFSQMRSDKAFCGPSRASLFTALNTNNHGCGTNEDVDYYGNFREGKKQTSRDVGSGNHWTGPWERDLALRAGLATTPVRAIDQTAGTNTNGRRNAQGVVGSATPAARGESVYDDLQASTGSLANWLAAAGVTTALIGKYTNSYAGQGTQPGPGTWNGVGYDVDATIAAIAADAAWIASQAKASGCDPVVALTNFYVPPGWNYWRGLVGTATSWGGGAQDHWSIRHLAYDGPNDPAGDGVECTNVITTRYDQPVTLTRSGSVPTATFTLGPHGLSIGDEICIEVGGSTADDRKWEGRWLTVATVPSTTTITYAFAGTTPTATSPVNGTQTCFPYRYYGEGVWSTAAVNFIETRGETEPWFLYYAPDNPHYAQLADGSSAPTHEAARRYAISATVGDVSDAAAFTFNGVPGWIADASGPCTWDSTAAPGSTARRTITSATARHDGTGPFRSDWVGRPAFITGTSVIPGGSTIVSCASNGMSCVISADPTAGSGDTWVTFGSQVTLPSEVTTARRQEWARRQQMLASIDDTIGAFLDAAEARGWHNLTIILTNDNGWNQGEHNVTENADQWESKLGAWEGSIRSILVVYNRKQWFGPVRSDVPVSHYDLAPTILDIFAGAPQFASLATHHVHSKRDGVSLLRLLADPGQALLRGQLIQNGDWEMQPYTAATFSTDTSEAATVRDSANGFRPEHNGLILHVPNMSAGTGTITYVDAGRVTVNRTITATGSGLAGYITAPSNGEGIVVGHRKLLRHWDRLGAEKLFDVTNDGFTGYPNYEWVDLAPANSAEVTALHDRLDALRQGRWLATTAAGAPTATGYQTFRSA